MRYSLYTDGSFKQNTCGTAFRWLDAHGDIVLQKAEIVQRGDSPYEAELCAVLYGLERIPGDAVSVRVVTDCQDLVHLWDTGIPYSHKRSKKVKWLESDLLNFKYHPATITFKWVKGHSGNRNNEAVDRLAGGAVDKKIGKRKKRKGGRNGRRKKGRIRSRH